MRVLLAAAMIALLAGPVYAQKQIPKYGEADPDKTPQEIEAAKAAEHAYKNSLGNIPDKGTADPWGTVRSGNAPKTEAKVAPAKPRTKTGSTAN